MQTATGCAAVVYLSCLDSKIILVAHQTLLISLAGTNITRTGIKDLIEGHYKKGCLELFMGTIGILGSALYAYNEIFSFHETVNAKEIPPQLDTFLKNHMNEIGKMYTKKQGIGKWTVLGQGVSKKAYIHPDSDYIIKIPHGRSFWGNSESDVVIHYNELQKAATLVNQMGYKYLTIPDAYLIEHPEGPLVVEQKFNIKSFSDTFRESQLSELSGPLLELDDFLKKGGYCDIDIGGNHNAGFLRDSADLSIGIYDLDCKNLTNSMILKKLMGYGSILSGSIFTSATFSEEFLESKYAKIASSTGLGLGLTTFAYCHPVVTGTLVLGATGGLILYEGYQTIKAFGQQLLESAKDLPIDKKITRAVVATGVAILISPNLVFNILQCTAAVGTISLGYKAYKSALSLIS